MNVTQNNRIESSVNLEKMSWNTPSLDSTGKLLSGENEQQESIKVKSDTRRLVKIQNKTVTSQNELENVKKITQNMKEHHKTKSEKFEKEESSVKN